MPSISHAAPGGLDDRLVHALQREDLRGGHAQHRGARGERSRGHGARAAARDVPDVEVHRGAPSAHSSHVKLDTYHILYTVYIYILYIISYIQYIYIIYHILYTVYIYYI